MQQHPIAMRHAARREPTRRHLDAPEKLGPGPDAIPPDQRRTVGMPPRCLDQEMREIGGWDQRKGSRIET